MRVNLHRLALDLRLRGLLCQPAVTAPYNSKSLGKERLFYRVWIRFISHGQQRRWSNSISCSDSLNPIVAHQFWRRGNLSFFLPIALLSVLYVVIFHWDVSSRSISSLVLLAPQYFYYYYYCHKTTTNNMIKPFIISSSK